MTVRELMKQLAEVDPNRQVCVLDLTDVVSHDVPIKYVDDTSDPVFLAVEVAEGEGLA